MPPPASLFPFLALIPALLAAALYIPGLGGSFILDDGFNILQNQLLYIEALNAESLINAALSFHDGNGARPLPMLSFALDYWRTGVMSPSAFKVTNVLIHAITTFCLAFLLRRLLLLARWDLQSASLWALIMALIWAIHPLQVSSVMYVVQRMQTMATLFIMLAMWAYLAMRQAQICGERGRGWGVLMLLFWALALACKEDAALLPAYLLALELTVLQFRASKPEDAKGLRQSYMLLAVLGGLAYFLVVVPHYWHWDAYPGRGFSTPERLLTQARVLVMHLGQFLLPVPDRLPFMYDNLIISRGVLQPVTTLPSLLLILALIAWAWRWRRSRPLFSLGVFLFFAGHFITSNVIGLELVFEHRNHFPLIGAVLATGDLLILFWKQLGLATRPAIGGILCIAALLGTATASHAHTWGDSIRHGQKLVELLPDSTRAWTQLGGAYYDRYKTTKNEEFLIKAVETNEQGLKHISSPSLASNLVIYKSILGSVTSADWDRFQRLLRDSPYDWQSKFVVWILMNNSERNLNIDRERVVGSIEILGSKTRLSASESLRMAVFIFKSSQQERALPFFVRFIEDAEAGSADVDRIIGELRNSGRDDWAQLLEVERGKKIGGS
ncbi:hypothetical protein [Thauera mechernichensis]